MIRLCDEKQADDDGSYKGIFDLYDILLGSMTDSSAPRSLRRTLQALRARLRKFLVSAEKAAKNGVRGIAALISAEMQLLTEDKPIPALKLVPAEPPTVDKEKKKTTPARSQSQEASKSADGGDVVFYMLLKQPEYAVR